MSGVIRLLGKFFLFLLELVVDLLCIVMFIAAVAAFWRIPSWPLEFDMGSRADFRFAALAAFGSTLFDLVTIPFGLVGFFSWRMPAFAADITWLVKDELETEKYWYQFRIACWMHFGLVLLDIPFIVMLAIIHACFWRIPFFWADMAEDIKAKGSSLLPCLSDDVERSSAARGPFESKQRQLIVLHCLEALCEILFIPIMLLLAVTVYRMPNVVALFKKRASFTSIELKGLVLLEFLHLIIDIPFFLMGGLTLIMGVRVKYMIEDLIAVDDDADDSDDVSKLHALAWKRRAAVAVNFALSFRDLLFLLLLVVLFACLVYRGYLALRQIMAKVARWAPLDPMIAVQDATLERPPEGRQTGLVLRVKGTKHPDAFLAPGTPLWLYIRNGEDFWPEVGRRFGATAATVGDMMMPATLARFVDASVISAGSTDVDLVIDFDVSKRTDSIQKSMAKLARPAVVQVEHGSHEGTVFSLQINFHDTLETTQLAPVVPAGNTDGARFGDVMWRIVLLQLAMLLLDVMAVLGFLLLHLIPPRAYRVYSRCMEPLSRTNLRRARDALEKAVCVLERGPAITVRTAYEIERELRKEQDQQAQRYAHTNQPVSASTTHMQPYATDVADALAPVLETLEKQQRQADVDVVVKGSEAIRGCLKMHLRAMAVEHGNISTAMPPKVFRKPTDLSTPAARVGAATQLVGIFSPDMQDVVETALGVRQQTADFAPAGDAFDLKGATRVQIAPHLRQLRQRAQDTQADYRAQPWCGGKEGWGGVRATVFREVKETLFDLLAVVCALFIVGTLYRVFPLVASVVGKRRDEDLRTKCVQQVVQVGVDLVYLLKSLLVIAGVRGAFKLPVDVATYVCAAPSFAVARQVVDHHFVLLLSDLVYLLSLVLAWDAIRLTLATVVFGAFAPGVLLESALVKWSGMNDGADLAGGYGHNARAAAPAAARHHRGQMSVESKDTCRAGMILLVAIGWMYGLPVFAGYYVGRSEGAPGAAAGLYFGVMAALVSLSIVVAFVYREPRVCELRRPVVRSVRPTLVNVLAYGSVALEGALLLAAAVWAVEPGREVASAGSDVRSAGLGVGDAARYAFGVFGQSWDGTSGLPVGAYASVAVMLLHFVLAAMPVVTGHMLHWRKGSRLTQSVAWVCALQVLGQYVLLAVTRNVAEVLKCTPDDASGAVVVASMGRTECYEGRHLHMAVLMMVLLTYYLPSSSMRNSTVDESACAALDVAYAQLYRLLTNAGGALGVVASGFLWEHPAVAAGCVAFAGVWGLGWTLGYPALANAAEGEVCTVRAVRVYRGAMYGAVAVGSAVLAGARGSGATGAWPLYACLGVVAAAWAAAAVGNHVASRGWAMEGAEECREVLLEAERELGGGRMLGPGWAVVRPRWVREVRGAARASTLAMAALVLEKHVFVGKLPRMFFASRGTWVRDTTRLVAECDRAAFIDVDEELGGERWEYLIVCCACDCCSHRRTDSDDSDDDVRDEEADVEEALRSATVLRNVARSHGPVPFFAEPITNIPAVNPNFVAESSDRFGTPTSVEYN